MANSEKLQGQNEQFRKDVIRLGENAWIAVGYAGSNICMIVGNDGLIIIDTSESTEAAGNILSEFRKISTLPVKTILYTHGHRDHISGATVFAEGGQPEIIARANFTNDLREGEASKWPLQCLLTRTKRQFGIGLKGGVERINIGVGPADRPLHGLGAGYLPPTNYITEDVTVIIRCGVQLTLVAAPGETVDQMFVWQPDNRILYCADNYYHSFPNLYAIRGTRFRDYELWAASLDRMLRYDAHCLAPGHTRPLFGAEQIRTSLTDYRDAIRFVIEKTIEGMDKHLTPDELVDYVRLPEPLASRPYLQEFYGTVEWAVRGLYSGLIGWFDGNPTNLSPLSPNDRARKYLELAGGAKALRQALNSALDGNDFHWVMEIADILIESGEFADEARSAKARALRNAGAQTNNSCARNYYISCAREIEQQLEAIRSQKK